MAPHSEALSKRGMTERIMNRLLMRHLKRRPGAMQEAEFADGSNVQHCIYPPHSLRATSATRLLDSGAAIEAVQDLLDHKHITTHAELLQAPTGGKAFRIAQNADLRQKPAT